MTPLPTTSSSFLVYGFIALSAAMLGLWIILGVRAGGKRQAWLTAVGGGVWMGGTGLAAHGGILAEFDQLPPPGGLVFFGGLVLAAVVAASPMGTRLSRLPLSWLVGLQVFRLPVELLIHRAVTEGVAPELMTWSGRNWDIVTPFAAVAAAIAIHRGVAPRRVAFGFNLLGLVLLANVVIHAVLALPTPFQQVSLDEPNIWVGHFPFVWLPTVLVVSALFGHLLVARALRLTPTS